MDLYRIPDYILRIIDKNLWNELNTFLPTEQYYRHFLEILYFSSSLNILKL
jgi:hypothetical protein